MSISRVKTWTSEVLTATDLNAEFENVVTNILPAAGQSDVNTMTSNVLCLTPALNKIVLGTQAASTSGTSVTFSSIPSGVRRITIMFSGVSTSGTSNVMVQIGDSGGLEATGYLGAATTIAGATPATANFTTGFGVQATTAAGTISHGSIVLDLMDAATFTWAARAIVGHSNATNISIGAGVKALTAELTQLAITTVGGAETFDAGAINISYER